MYYQTFLTSNNYLLRDHYIPYCIFYFIG